MIEDSRSSNQRNKYIQRDSQPSSVNSSITIRHSYKVLPKDHDESFIEQNLNEDLEEYENESKNSVSVFQQINREISGQEVEVAYKNLQKKHAKVIQEYPYPDSKEGRHKAVMYAEGQLAYEKQQRQFDLFENDVSDELDQDVREFGISGSHPQIQRKVTSHASAAPIHPSAKATFLQPKTIQTKASKIQNIESLNIKTSQIALQAQNRSKYMMSSNVVSRMGVKDRNIKSPSSLSKNSASRAVPRPNSRMSASANEEAVQEQIRNRRASHGRYVALLDRVFKKNERSTSRSKTPGKKAGETNKTPFQNVASPTKSLLSPIGNFKISNLIKNQLGTRNTELTAQTDPSQKVNKSSSMIRASSKANTTRTSMVVGTSKHRQNRKDVVKVIRDVIQESLSSERMIEAPQIISPQIATSRVQIRNQGTKQNIEQLELKLQTYKQSEPLNCMTVDSRLDNLKAAITTNPSLLEFGSVINVSQSINSGKSLIRKKSRGKDITTRIKSPINLNNVSKANTINKVNMSTRVQTAPPVKGTAYLSKMPVTNPSKESKNIPFLPKKSQTRYQIPTTRVTPSLNQKRSATTLGSATVSSTAQRALEKKSFNLNLGGDRTSFVSPLSRGLPSKSLLETGHQIQTRVVQTTTNGMQRKVDMMIERKNNKMGRSGKAKPEKKVLSEENRSSSAQRQRMTSPVPAGGGLIPKSKEYLRKNFEQEFFPIIQKILKREANEQLILMLENDKSMAHIEDKQRNKEFLFQGEYSKNGKSIDLNSQDFKIKIAHKSLGLRLKMEHLEEILTKMGFMRQQNIFMQDKLDFVKLWEHMSKKQQRRDLKNARSSLPEKYRQSIEANDEKSDVSNLSDYFQACEELKEEEVDTEDLIITIQEQKEVKVQVKFIIRSLLNISGIWKSELSVFRDFYQLRENRDKFYKEEIRQQSVQGHIKQTITENNKKKAETVKAQKRKASCSNEPTLINKNGFFGAPDKQAKKQQILVHENEYNPTKQTANDAFKNMLREPFESKNHQRGASKSSANQSTQRQKKNLNKRLQSCDLSSSPAKKEYFRGKLDTETDLDPPSFSMKAINLYNQTSSNEKKEFNVLKVEFQDRRVQSAMNKMNPDEKKGHRRYESLKNESMILENEERALTQRNPELEQPGQNTKEPIIASITEMSLIQSKKELSVDQSEKRLQEKSKPIISLAEDRKEQESYSAIMQKRKQIKNRTSSQSGKKRSRSRIQISKQSVDGSIISQSDTKSNASKKDGSQNFRNVQKLDMDKEIHLRINSEPDQDQNRSSLLTAVTKQNDASQVIHDSKAGQLLVRISLSSGLLSQKEEEKQEEEQDQTYEEPSLGGISDIDIKIKEAETQLEQIDQVILQEHQQDKLNIIKQIPRSTFLQLPEIGEIKEEFREDSESDENDFMQKVLRTSDCKDLMDLESNQSMEFNILEIRSEDNTPNRNSSLVYEEEQKKIKISDKKSDMLSELRSEAQSFIQKQSNLGSEQTSNLLPRKLEVNAQQYTRIQVPSLFSEDHKAEDPLQLAYQSKSSGAPVENKYEIIQNQGPTQKESHERSSSKKFTSKLAGKNLMPMSVSSNQSNITNQKAVEIEKQPQKQSKLRHSKTVTKNKVHHRNTSSPTQKYHPTLESGKNEDLDILFKQQDEEAKFTPGNIEKSERERSTEIFLQNPQDMRPSPAKPGSDLLSFSDQSSIFKQNISENYTKMLSINTPSSAHPLVPTVKTPHKIIKFEIYVDNMIGTQVIEIRDKKDIGQAVDTFALKYDINNRQKVSKLKKYIKQEFKEKLKELNNK